MARKSPILSVRTAPSAASDLSEIWLWNFRRYDFDHANKYIQFLQDESDKLSAEYPDGRRVPGRPEYQFVTIRKGHGHAHVAVYWVIDQVVEIVHYFHTAQDWQSHLDEESD